MLKTSSHYGQYDFRGNMFQSKPFFALSTTELLFYAYHLVFSILQFYITFWTSLSFTAETTHIKVEGRGRRKNAVVKLTSLHVSHIGQS
jgi:hypothetical protein